MIALAWHTEFETAMKAQLIAKFLRMRQIWSNPAVFPSLIRLFTRSTAARVNRVTTEGEKEKPRSVEYHAARHARMRSLSRQIGLRDITIVVSLSFLPMTSAERSVCAAAFGKSDNLARQWARKVKRVCPSLECPFATQWLLPGCFSVLFRRGGGVEGAEFPLGYTYVWVKRSKNETETEGGRERERERSELNRRS